MLESFPNKKEQDIILNIPDSLFKQLDIKKMYKLQKIYYYDIFIKNILNKFNQIYHDITAYMNAKKFEKTEKKVITENKFIEKPSINIISELIIELVENKRYHKKDGEQNKENKENDQQE